MEYLSRLSGLVSTPVKAAAGVTGTPRLRKKPSLHPVGSVDIFHADWQVIHSELDSPDERALFFGVARSDLPRRLQRIVDALVFESNRSNDGHTGPCMEYLLKYDILTELVHLSVDDRPKGIRGETIRTLTNLIILLDEKFLSRQAVNKPISQLIQLCLDEDAARFQLDDDSFDTSVPSSAPAAAVELDYEEDLVDLMCHIASRIRNTPDLLQIFFSDEPVDDGDNTEDSRSLRDGSIIVGRDVFDDPISSSPKLAKEEFDTPSAEPRPPSPAESVDSTATIQPSTAHSVRRHSKRRLRFPLFSYLLKFVHREGRIGELARAGLLFLISLEGVHPSAKQSAGTKTRKAPKRVSFGHDDIRRSLAIFIAHSDFADVLGAGLGAAYGLLPSRIKPVPRYDPTSIDSSSSAGRKASITLASSTASDASVAPEPLASATQSDDAELQAQLRLLVDLIEFCQDVLDSLWMASKHLTEATTASFDSNSEKRLLSPAAAVAPNLDPMIRKLARAIAIAIRDTFIRNVVYPSLMESSDFDGSSAAVLNYLDVIVIVLRSGHILTDVVLDFLLPTNATDQAGAEGYIINVPTDEADRYTVKDLILDSIADGKRPATRVAALRLARSLIVCHGFHSYGGLLQLPRRDFAAAADDWQLHDTSAQKEDGSVHSKITLHFREIDALSSLLSSFASQSAESLQASLSNYLLDAEQALRFDSTFGAALDLGATNQMRLVSDDAFVQQLFSSLASFFSQPVEVNLAVSGTISALAASPIRSLEGWLTHTTGQDGDEPALLDLLRGLIRQVEGYRTAVPSFDELLAERRRSLVLTEDLEDALNIVDPDTSADTEEGEDGVNGVAACLSLPRVAKGSKVLRIHDERRYAEREFGILSDRRSSLPALTPAPTSAPSTEPSAAPQTQPPPGPSSAMARLFGGRPTRPPVTPTPRTALGPTGRTLSASTINPYAEHYRQTAAVRVRTSPASGAENWRPANNAAEEKHEGGVTLSSVLDSVVLLEELIKELLALMQVRRSWGIDPISFV